ncbi:MAG: hypothetical protein JG781_1898 [Peptococcaceae bacterium]|jgi:3D (Asp-Asp-Asp) domain-containing protein|nr:hypothetical protein [Peptococcaceae bacterium]
METEIRRPLRKWGAITATIIAVVLFSVFFYITITHHTLSIPEIMNKAGIKLNPMDKVVGELSKKKLPVHLAVVRVEESFYEQEEIVPFPKERQLDPSLKKGEIKVVQKGEDGLVRKKYLIHTENGLETDRKVVETEVLKEVKPEIITMGTKGTIMIASRSLVNPKKVLTLQATAYTHTGNNTYTGVYPRIGTIAVDPRVIPLGTRMWVEGYGYGIAQDTGGLIKGNIIDLFMDTKEDCLRWGRRNVKVYILE